MSQFDNLRDKAGDYLKDHPEKAEQLSDETIEGGGDMADKGTGGKFDQHTDKAQEASDERIGGADAERP